MARISLRVPSFCVLLALLVCAPVRNCFAQSEPDQVLRDLMAQIKEKGTAAPLIEAVDWESAFKKFEPWQLNNMRIKTPDDLKEYNRKFMEDPRKALEDSIYGQVMNSPKAQEPEEMKRIETLVQSMVQQIEIQQKNLARIDYEVGKAQITESDAKVPLTVSLEGREDSQTVELKKIDGKWYLTDILNFGKVLSSGQIAVPEGFSPANEPTPSPQ